MSNPPDRPSEREKVRREFTAIRRSARLARTDRRAVFVLATARSGSYLLLDLLNSLDGVSLGGEVLNRDAPFGPSRLVRGPRTAALHLRAAVWSRSSPITGAKLLLGQMESAGLDLRSVMDLFPGGRFVLLYRQSLADQFLSLRAAERTRQFQAGAGETVREPGPLRVDLADFDRFRRRIEALNTAAVETPGFRASATTISYEELAADPCGVVDRRLRPTLDLPAGEVRVSRVKLNTRPKSDMVENWAEVATELQAAVQRF